MNFKEAASPCPDFCVGLEHNSIFQVKQLEKLSLAAYFHKSEDYWYCASGRNDDKNEQ